VTKFRRCDHSLNSKRRSLPRKDGGEAEEKTLLVAQGDSWFDYPPGLDLIFWLKKSHGYRIENFAEAGDTLENMVYGTKFTTSNWRRYPCRMNQVAEVINRSRPKGILFSAGGNDLAGDPLDDYYNHVDSGLPEERIGFMSYMFDEVFFRGYCEFIENVCAAAGTQPSAPDSPMIVGHSYANAIPDGRAVANFLGFHWIGPWLRPTFTRKGYDRLTSTIQLVASLIGRFVAMLEKVKNKYPKNFDYVDFRGLVSGNDWANELHLNNSAYEKCAKALAQKLNSHGI
jgi:hypothetical protein